MDRAPEPRRGLDDLGRDRLQHVQQDVGVAHLAPESLVIGFIDNGGREIERREDLQYPLRVRRRRRGDRWNCAARDQMPPFSLNAESASRVLAA